MGSIWKKKLIFSLFDSRSTTGFRSFKRGNGDKMCWSKGCKVTASHTLRMLPLSRYQTWAVRLLEVYPTVAWNCKSKNSISEWFINRSHSWWWIGSVCIFFNIPTLFFRKNQNWQTDGREYSNIFASPCRNLRTYFIFWSFEKCFIDKFQIKSTVI